MSTIQSDIERTFFEAIRTLLVTDGYTPDIANTTLFPNTTTGYDAYIAALEAIRASAKGFAVEVFGTANPQSKGLKDLPRISLHTSAFVPGEVGYDTTPVKVLNTQTNKYELFSYDSLTYDLFIDCRVVAENQAQLRILMDIVHRAIPLKGYIPYYNATNDSFLVMLDSFQDTTDAKDATLEYNYRYEVPDIQWRGPVQVETTPPAGIAPINKITLNLKILEHLGISTIIV